MSKTWGENPLIQSIRIKLRALKKEAVYPYRHEYRSGYHSAIDDALKSIRKVVHNEARQEKKKRVIL